MKQRILTPVASGAHIPDLSYDIYHWIIQEVASTSRYGYRDPECVNSLLACCLVNSSWRQLAQPILNQTIVANTPKQLDRRLFHRSRDPHLKGVRTISLCEKDDIYFTIDVVAVLKALPSLPRLRSFHCYNHGLLSGSSDQKDREDVGKPRVIPHPVDLDLSSLRHATLGSIANGANWVPFLMATPTLQHLTLHGLGWWGNSSYANSPLYLPYSLPPFRLKRLDIIRSHIKESPLRWLLSGSSETLTYLEVSYLQAEWDTLKNLSKIRAEGLLPNITHLTCSKSDRHGGAAKYYKENTTVPLTLWNGLHTVYLYGVDAKSTNAIIHGISQLSPIPRIEMGVGDMRLHEFRAKFRLRKGKFREGTKLRLVTGEMAGGRGYIRWDGEAETYWEEMREVVMEIAEKNGIEIEIAKVALYERNSM